jgi:hypothetical protein
MAWKIKTASYKRDYTVILSCLKKVLNKLSKRYILITF